MQHDFNSTIFCAFETVLRERKIVNYFDDLINRHKQGNAEYSIFIGKIRFYVHVQIDCRTETILPRLIE